MDSRSWDSGGEAELLANPAGERAKALKLPEVGNRLARIELGLAAYRRARVPPNHGHGARFVAYVICRASDEVGQAISHVMGHVALSGPAGPPRLAGSVDPEV